MLSIRQTILQAPHRPFQSNNSVFSSARFTSAFNQHQARNIIESPSEMAGAMADKAKAGSMNAMETGREMGEKAMHTVDNAVETGKETTHKIKDTIAEADDAGQVKRQQPTYSIVEDVRSRERGYD